MMYDMTTQKFIKNAKKYNKMKLCKAVILDKVANEERHGNTGISSKTTANVWHMLPKGRAIFKNFEGVKFFEPIKNMRIANELVCYELSKQVGVLCAEYELASLKGTTGVVSYDVAKNGEYLMDGYDLIASIEKIEDMSTLKTYAQAFKKFKTYGYNYDNHEVLTKLFKIVVFDTLTIQSDRYNANILFLLDEKNKQIKVAPIIDNEFAFNLQYFDYVLGENGQIDANNFKSSLQQIERLVQTKSLDREERLNRFKSNVDELVKIAQQNKEFKNILTNMIDSYNMEKAISKVEQNGLKISKDYKKYLLYTEKYMKETFENELKDYKEVATEYKFLYEK